MSALSKLKAKLHEWLDGAYYIGIVENADDVLRHHSKHALLNINWIKLNGHKGSWFADPFIIDADEEKITLFVEEYEYATCRGLLSEIVVDRKSYDLLNVHPVLRQETHLSYPYFIKHNGEFLVVPESCQRGEAALYTFNEGRMLERKRLLIEGKLLDTQFTKIGNRWYAFAVKATADGLDATKRLYIYESDALEGEYKEIQQIINTKNEERGAGLMFEYNGRLLRPAQVCEGGYGKGVILYEMKLENGTFQETEYARFMANPSQKKGLCLHSFSMYKDLIAVDGFDYDCRAVKYFTPFLYSIKNIINKIVGKVILLYGHTNTTVA